MPDQLQTQIRDEFDAFASKRGPAVIVPAQVIAVDDQEGTVEIELSDGTRIDDARLQAVVMDGNHFWLLPEEDSFVQVGRIENSDEYLVVAVSRITGLKAQFGDIAFGLDNQGLLLKKDDSLRSLITELLDAIIAERHQTAQGPTISLTTLSRQRFVDLKAKFNNLLRHA